MHFGPFLFSELHIVEIADDGKKLMPIAAYAFLTPIAGDNIMAAA